MKDRMLALVCRVCPACVACRVWPASAYARFMARLERHCPFCRAYARLHSGGGR